MPSASTGQGKSMTVAATLASFSKDNPWAVGRSMRSDDGKCSSKPSRSTPLFKSPRTFWTRLRNYVVSLTGSPPLQDSLRIAPSLGRKGVQPVYRKLGHLHKDHAAISETDNMGHVRKGTAKNVFYLFVCKVCTIPGTIIAEYRRFQKVKSRSFLSSFPAFRTQLPHLPVRDSEAALERH